MVVVPIAWWNYVWFSILYTVVVMTIRERLFLIKMAICLQFDLRLVCTILFCISDRYINSFLERFPPQLGYLGSYSVAWNGNYVRLLWELRHWLPFLRINVSPSDGNSSRHPSGTIPISSMHTELLRSMCLISHNQYNAIRQHHLVWRQHQT